MNQPTKPLFSSRRELEAYQLDRLNRLLGEILPANGFYREKFAGLPSKLDSLEQWPSFPTTTKLELSQAADEHGVAPHHTYPHDEYTRFHRTSGSTGRPLIVMDRPADWRWWIVTWQDVLDAAELTSRDVVFMAFSFGPFIGFWSANEACLSRGCRVVPGGGLSTAARIELIQDAKCTTLFTTPSYALHLAAEAKQRGIDPASIGLRKIIVAGEPGGSILDVRQKIEATYQARLIDHAGATEVGPWGFGTRDGLSLEVIEREFIAEFVPVSGFTRPPVARSSGRGAGHEGPPSSESSSTRTESSTKSTLDSNTNHTNSQSTQPLFELILTPLGRAGAPILRYRTGDLVSPVFYPIQTGNNVRLQGGILGRVDQMLTIRGVNIIPSSIEAILRSFQEVIEYRLIADRQGEMDKLSIEVEDTLHDPSRIIDLFDRRLGLRVEVIDIPIDTLPRFQDKAKRFLDRRKKT